MEVGDSEMKLSTQQTEPRVLQHKCSVTTFNVILTRLKGDLGRLVVIFQRNPDNRVNLGQRIGGVGAIRNGITTVSRPDLNPRWPVYWIPKEICSSF